MSLAANVAVAEPTLTGRTIAAWASFALTAPWELLTRQVRNRAPASDGQGPRCGPERAGRGVPAEIGDGSAPPRELQRRARWPTCLSSPDRIGSGQSFKHYHPRHLCC